MRCLSVNDRFVCGCFGTQLFLLLKDSLVSVALSGESVVAENKSTVKKNTNKSNSCDNLGRCRIVMSQFLLLDEATANIDTNSDNLIQV